MQPHQPAKAIYTFSLSQDLDRRLQLHCQAIALPLEEVICEALKLYLVDASALLQFEQQRQ